MPPVLMRLSSDDIGNPGGMWLWLHAFGLSWTFDNRCWHCTLVQCADKLTSLDMFHASFMHCSVMCHVVLSEVPGSSK